MAVLPRQPPQVAPAPLSRTTTTSGWYGQQLRSGWHRGHEGVADRNARVSPRKTCCPCAEIAAPAVDPLHTDASETNAVVPKR